MSRVMHSRRAFLQQVSAGAAALGLLTPLPARPLWALPAHELAPDIDEALLRELALQAVEAARRAGASFADVRVGAGQTLLVASVVGQRGLPSTAPPSLGLEAGYGIRAVVDGAWGFAAAQELTPDVIAQTAQCAVARARANRPRRPRTLELAPTSRVAEGQWTVPIVEDPFAIAPGEQADQQMAALAAAAAAAPAEFRSAQLGFTWSRAVRVFASSEGTLLRQRTAFAVPRGHAEAHAGEGYQLGAASVSDLEEGEGPYGYEVVTRVDLPTALGQAIERAIERSKAPRLSYTSVEPGRYDLVLDWEAMSRFVTATLADALNAERALGYQANRDGTSFATPPAEMVGKYQLGSPLLTVRADRTRPHGAATVQWDDEGVPTEAFALVQDGVIVDYLTDRQSAPELAAGYGGRGLPVRSHGCARGFGIDRPSVRLPNLTLEPGREALSVEDLIRDTKRGLYILRLHGQADQQVLSGQFTTGGVVRAIRNGRLAEPTSDVAIQFATPAFWKSLDALGGATTLHTRFHPTGVGGSLNLHAASVSTVPGRLRQVNVLNRGGTP